MPTKKLNPKSTEHRAGKSGRQLKQAASSTLIDEVRDLRGKCGFSQEDLARLIGASWATVSRWERGIARPAADTEAKLKRLVELDRRIDGAIAPQEFVHFLTTPAPLLRGYPPQDLLQSAYSFQDLLAYIDSAKSGDMA